jgi:hypothetical protein
LLLLASYKLSEVFFGSFLKFSCTSLNRWLRTLLCSKQDPSNFFKNSKFLFITTDEMKK